MIKTATQEVVRIAALEAFCKLPVTHVLFTLSALFYPSHVKKDTNNIFKEIPVQRIKLDKVLRTSFLSKFIFLNNLLRKLALK